MAITKHEAKEALNHLLLGFEFAEECDFSDDTENGKAKNIIKDIVNNYIASLTERSEMEKLIVKVTNFCVDKHPDKSDMPRADYYHAVGQTLTEIRNIYNKYIKSN